jgi:RimJ/RimL family protein N-acetyltransferase
VEVKRIVLNDKARVIAFVQATIGKGTAFSPEHAAAIGLERDGELIAGVIFDNYNGANCAMHVAAIPGKRWLDREFLYVCFGYPFNQLGLKRVTGMVCSSNLEALRFDLHLGFVQEAVLKDATTDGDLILLVMRRENCRWLALQRKAA